MSAEVEESPSRESGAGEEDIEEICDEDFVEAAAKKLPPLIVTPFPEKVIVHFQAVAGTPILKKKKFKISSLKAFYSVYEFLRRQLKCAESDPLFIYCHQSFAPTNEQLIGDLFDCFRTGKELILYYSSKPAWG